MANPSLQRLPLPGFQGAGPTPLSRNLIALPVFHAHLPELWRAEKIGQKAVVSADYI